jgi:hypothetical protein
MVVCIFYKICILYSLLIMFDLSPCHLVTINNTLACGHLFHKGSSNGATKLFARGQSNPGSEQL